MGACGNQIPWKDQFRVKKNNKTFLFSIDKPLDNNLKPQLAIYQVSNTRQEPLTRLTIESIAEVQETNPDSTVAQIKSAIADLKALEESFPHNTTNNEPTKPRNTTNLILDNRGRPPRALHQARAARSARRISRQ